MIRMRQIVLGICFVALVCLLYPIRNVRAQQDTTAYSILDDENNIEYGVIANGKLDYVKGASGGLDLTWIVDEAKKYDITITSIGSHAFQNSHDITGVYLPSDIRRIEDGAFQDLEALTTIRYCTDSQLEYIGDHAFMGAEKLRRFLEEEEDSSDICHFPDSLTTLGEYAFSGTFISDFVVPDKVTEIRKGTFRNCFSLNKVTLPDTLTDIGERAFENTGLGIFMIPDKVTTIGESAFEGSEIWMTSVPDGVTEIADGAFRNSKMLQITMPETITKIGANAFEGTPMKSVIIPDAVTSIGDCAFLNAHNLAQLTLPDTGEFTIGKQAFYGTAIEDLTIPQNCKKISEQAFSGDEQEQSTLATVRIENSTVVIANNAFSRTTVIYAETGSTAYIYSTNNGNTFVSTSVNVSEDDDVEGDKKGNDNATTQETGNTNEQQKTGLMIGRQYTIGGLIYQAKDDKTVIFVKPAKKTITRLVIPDTVTIEGIKYPVIGVESKACYRCKKLKQVKLGNQIQDIGKQAFAECTKLQKITFGKGLIHIGAKCFAKDKKLKTVVIRSKQLKTVGKGCMKGTNRKNIVVPKNKKAKYQKLFQKAA